MRWNLNALTEQRAMNRKVAARCQKWQICETTVNKQFRRKLCLVPGLQVQCAR